MSEESNRDLPQPPEQQQVSRAHATLTRPGLSDWFIRHPIGTTLLTVGIVSVAGVVVGSAAYSVVTKSFRWEGFRGAEDTANHLVGALMMGVGGVSALGCTVGQGLSGMSTLSLSSFVAVAAIIAGAVAALRYQIWRVERMA